MVATRMHPIWLHFSDAEAERAYLCNQWGPSILNDWYAIRGTLFIFTVIAAPTLGFLFSCDGGDVACQEQQDAAWEATMEPLRTNLFAFSLFNVVWFGYLRHVEDPLVIRRVTLRVLDVGIFVYCCSHMYNTYGSDLKGSAERCDVTLDIMGFAAAVCMSNVISHLMSFSRWAKLCMFSMGSVCNIISPRFQSPLCDGAC